MEATRSTLAAELLLEAVYASRSRQGAANTLGGGDPSCGLGAKPELASDLTERGRELLAALWPGGPGDPDGLRRAMSAWVRRQDAFDRRRNHYLKDFRGEHGFDRSAYSDEVRAAYEAGLEEINAENRSAQTEAAAALLAGQDPGS